MLTILLINNALIFYFALGALILKDYARCLGATKTTLCPRLSQMILLDFFELLIFDFFLRHCYYHHVMILLMTSSLHYLVCCWFYHVLFLWWCNSISFLSSWFFLDDIVIDCFARAWMDYVSNKRRNDHFCVECWIIWRDQLNTECRWWLKTLMMWIALLIACATALVFALCATRLNVLRGLQAWEW